MGQEVAETDQLTVLEIPRGMYPSRVDDRGRLKLPMRFQEYFNKLVEKTIFITSLDRKVARIYPIATWRQNEAFFEKYLDNPKLSRRAAFIANELGEECEMDAQGRVSLSTDLRKELGLVDKPVKIYSHMGGIDVLNEETFQALRDDSLTLDTTGLDELRRAGLK